MVIPRPDPPLAEQADLADVLGVVRGGGRAHRTGEASTEGLASRDVPGRLGDGQGGMDQRRLVVVLHARQPLTTDVTVLAPNDGTEVAVLTVPGGGPTVREDVLSPPPRVVTARTETWATTIRGLAGSRPVDVVTNDEYCLLDC